MSQHEQHGAKGSMYLKRDWEESSGGHVDTYDDAFIKATDDEKSVVLNLKTGSTNAHPNSSSTLKISQFEIGVEVLIKLIKEHGKPVKIK